MPLTKIEAISALIVIDLQKGFAGLPTVHPAREVIDRSARLARAFRAHGWPVILVNVAGRAPGRTDAGPHKMALPPAWTELVPELEQQPADLTVTKERVGAFIGTGLDEILRARKVTQVFLTGVATSAGVEATARSAYDHGYHVVLVSDAMTDVDADAHRHSLEKIFPRLGEVESTANILERIESGG